MKGVDIMLKLNMCQIIALTIVVLLVLALVAIYCIYPIQSILATVILAKYNN